MTIISKTLLVPWYVLHHSWQVYLAGTNPKKYQISVKKKSDSWLRHLFWESFKNPVQKPK